MTLLYQMVQEYWPEFQAELASHGRYLPGKKPGHIWTPPRNQVLFRAFLDYLAKDDLPSFDALGPVSMLKAFAKSVGRRFINGHDLGNRLCPE
jgi:hypothetical protein